MPVPVAVAVVVVPSYEFCVYLVVYTRSVYELNISLVCFVSYDGRKYKFWK